MPEIVDDLLLLGLLRAEVDITEDSAKNHLKIWSLPVLQPLYCFSIPSYSVVIVMMIFLMISLNLVLLRTILPQLSLKSYLMLMIFPAPFGSLPFSSFSLALNLVEKSPNANEEMVLLLS